MIVNHGEKINQRVLVSSDPQGQGRQWTMDACFPDRMDSEVDLWGIDEGAANFLTGIVKAIRPVICFETGTHKGRSTRAIAEGLVENSMGHLWTIDMHNYSLMTSGALRESEKERVTQIVGQTPEIFTSPDLEHCKDIEFAFLDGAHDQAGLVADLDFVIKNKAEKCTVIVDNADDAGWPEIREFFKTYTDFQHMRIPTMCGMQLIQMG